MKEAGEHSDSYGGKNECEYFYYMLNDIEDNEFHLRFEQKQCIEISLEYKLEIKKDERAIQSFHSIFQKLY